MKNKFEISNFPIFGAKIQIAYHNFDSFCTHSTSIKTMEKNKTETETQAQFFLSNYFCEVWKQCWKYEKVMKLSVRLLASLSPNSLKLSQCNLVPELRLHLLTSNHPLWHNHPPNHFEERSNDPFWAIFWPGGQVLSRYLLDTKVAQNQRVLDLGCGCGAQG